MHRTIELCLDDRLLEPNAAWERACGELALTGPDPRTAPNARRSFLRLQRRLPELFDYVARRDPTETRREHVLTSPDGVVTGQIDLLVLGGRPSVVDHKTGFVLADGLPREQYERQLALYAWLVEVALGIEVNDAALFSLREGVVEVDVSRGIREGTAAEALRARAEFNDRSPGAQPATPSNEACGRCPFVGSCDPSWAALEQGVVDEFGWGDAARGPVRAPVVMAAGGTAAIPLHVEVGTVKGEAMLIDVPAPLVEACSTGDRVSAWRLARRSEEPLTLAWREGASAIELTVVGGHG